MPLKAKVLKKSGILDDRGFTLVELMVAIAVFAVLAAVLTPIFKQGSGFWQSTQSQAELRQNLNSALEIIAKEIRQSNHVVPGSAVNEGETIVTVGGNSFLLQAGPDDKKYIEFKSEPITSTSLLDITNAQVLSLKSPANGYEISISARYTGNAAIGEADKEMTVSTRVFVRSVDGIQTWRETN